MPSEPSPFCGREQESSRLWQAWQEVRAGQGPRTVVVLAEAGLGKTRLAQEFYRQAVASEEGDGSGYWPAELGAQNNDSLRVNPPEASWNAEAAMPFLWWGLRLVNPSVERAATGVLAAHVERDLLPHLAPFHREQRRRARRKQLGMLGAGTAVDVAVDLIPFMGLVKKAGEVGVELWRMHREERQDAGLSADGFLRQQRGSLIERLMDDLELLFQGPAGRAVPAVVLIDDAQFSPADPGLTAFVQALLPAMQAGGWPLLLLVTHWEQEWSTQLRFEEPTVATALARHGELHPGSVQKLRLGPLPDLAPLLAAGLPGLRQEQADALLQRAGGNPRFLGEIVRFAQGRRGRGLFEGMDQSRPLKQEGLRELLSLSVSLHEIIANRLADSPDEVQKALVLASVQGEEFLARLVAETAASLAEAAEPIGQAIGLAQDPHAYVARLDEGRAAFAQRIYFEVASQHLRNWYELQEVEEALSATLLRWFSDEEAWGRISEAERGPVLSLASDLLKDAADTTARRAASHATCLLLEEAKWIGDQHAARALALRLAELAMALPEEHLDGELRWFSLPVETLLAGGDHQAARPLLERWLGLTQRTLEEEPGLPWAVQMHARALLAEADHWEAIGDRRLHRETLASAFEVMRAGLEQLPDEDPEVASAAGELFHRLGVALLVDGRDLGSAAEALQASLQLRSQLSAQQPERLDRRLALHGVLQGLASLAVQQGDWAQARRLRQEALDGLRRLVDEGHGGFDLQVQVAVALQALALTTNDQEEKARLLLEALPLFRAHQQAADTVERRDRLASLLRLLAQCARMDQELDPALAFAEEAVALARRSQEQAPSPDHRRALSMALIELHEVQLARRDPAAFESGQEALEQARAMVGAYLDTFDRRTFIEAVIAAARGPGRDEEDWLQRLAEADGIYQTAPAEARAYLASTEIALASTRRWLHQRLGDQPAAEAQRRRMLELAAEHGVRITGLDD